MATNVFFATACRDDLGQVAKLFIRRTIVIAGRIRGRNPLFLMVLTLIAAVAAACGGGSDEIGSGSLSSQTLTIYSGRSDTLVDPIIQQFGQATGIKVRVNYASTPQLAATLLEEGGNTPADIFFAQDPGGLGAVVDMLSTLPGSILNRVPDWARSPTGKWVGISGRARTVVYNTERLTEADLPDDIFDFIDP